MKQKLLARGLFRPIMLLLVLLGMGSGQAWGEEKNIAADALTNYVLTSSPFTLTFEKKGGSTAPTYNSNGGDLRLYAKGTLTIASTEANITRIVFNLSTQGKKRLAPITASVGEISTQASGDETVTWTGNVASVTFTVGDNANYGSDGSTKAGQLCFNSVDITYTPNTGGDTPATPTFNPVAGTYSSAQSVTINTTTDGATIYYTTDGNAPTTSSSVYENAIQVSSTTTIKAIAVKDGMNNSAVAEATYTIVNLEHAGTEADPYSVADAITVIQALQDGNPTTQKFYVRGVVRKFYATSTDGTATDITKDDYHRYYIGDLNSENELLVYRGKKSETESFSDANDLLINDMVTIYGSLQKYSNSQGVTPEIASGNYITSLYREYRVSFAPSHCDMTVWFGGQRLVDRSPIPAGSTITINNITAETGYGTPEIVVTDANGNPVTLTYDTEQQCYTFTLNSDVTITATAYELTANGIVLDTNSGSTPYGTPLTVDYMVEDDYDGTLTFSPNAIADVTAENGTLTFTPKAVGGAEITITAPATAHFAAAETTFNITVTAPEGKTTAKPAVSGLIFGESFGDNSEKARTWDDEYSVKSGVAAVYADIDGYTVSNVKQGKNTTGSDGSGLNQSSQGTDASIIIGPLNVADYKDLSLTYQWKAASINGTYSTAAYYATSAEGEYTEVTGTGDGATTFVERSYALPAAAQVSTLYLKIVWNTSNTQGIIDEIQLFGTGVAGTETVKLNASGYATYCSEYPLDFTDAEANGYSAWAVTGVEGENITFSQITGTIVGGTGVLLKGTAGATVQLVSAASENQPTNQLEGTLAPTYVEANQYYGLSGNTFKKINAGTVPAHKAMLPASAVSSQGVKAFTFVFGGTTTGVNAVDNGQWTMDNGAIFSLSGQRLAKPQKGINIINGKKVLVK